ncbi:hypothetical protein GCM10011516_14750 [Sphingobacterium cellulitidis]|uniref:DNA sulfur modification protein DndD n=2 Tax=Sphingobacterium cellulitidis TaxID=1768011 RepID=A0A8H9KXB4_9SPHI|nr:hypothetical protein GCM10011516_14750 [Sphingobacterium soli]
MIWCLYGKVMVDVDEKYRREIYEAGGYRLYASKNLNRKTHAKFEQFLIENEVAIGDAKKYHRENYERFMEQKNKLSSYSVKVVLSDISIPSVVCDEVSIERTFNMEKGEDILTILIDGQVNELTKEVGPEIFIQDFVLPKEIAKFFFFDAEKIVSLAEMKSLDEKQSLSKAYAEVLGIKKYEDLRQNLENVRLRLRKASASGADRKKFDELHADVEKSKRLIEEYTEQIETLQEEKLAKKIQADQYQEKLIREGSSITVEELNELRAEQKQLAADYDGIKSRMKDLLEMAPFAMAGKKIQEVRDQVLAEAQLESKELDPILLTEHAKKVREQVLTDTLSKLKIKKQQLVEIGFSLEQVIMKVFGSDELNDTNLKVLLSFTPDERNEFEAIYSNLKYSYNQLFKQLVDDQKKNRIAYNRVIRKLSEAESKEKDVLVHEIRKKKIALDNVLEQIEKDIIAKHIAISDLQKELVIKTKQESELAKKIRVEEVDLAKDEVAARLISELDVFIKKFKSEKKSLLERSLKKELNLLMHKEKFVDRVEVEVGSDLIDIHLYDTRGEVVNKDTLSKGEQQLYATALLKALVDESNIKFPIFIDSPLQKFDKFHSENIIKEFYPNVSEQVVLFPLLEKELSEDEYNMLLPRVNSVHLIKNIDDDHSTFNDVPVNELFTYYQQLASHV